MNQDDFVAQHQKDWDSFQNWLAQRGRSDSAWASATAPAAESESIPALYRRLCHHLSIARGRQYTTDLVERLHNLVLMGHRELYSARASVIPALVRFVTGGFAQVVRQEWRLIWLTTLLFYGPAVALGVGVYFNPDFAYTVMDPGTIIQMEVMYDPDNDVLGRERDAASDVAMFGFYIWNNVRIAFQTFAGGVFFAIGSIFFLVYNGIFIGTVAGYLTQAGFIETFWGFVSGHSALELTAITISGAAGMKIGLALLAPGRRKRGEAFWHASQIAIGLVYGAAIMLVGAAFLEAFWSSKTSMPVNVKYVVGLSFWALMIAYFLFAGRRRET